MGKNSTSFYSISLVTNPFFTGFYTFTAFLPVLSHVWPTLQESGGDKRAFYVDSFGFCKVKDFFAEKPARSEITFTVAECGEFHSLGRYRDDISNAEEAIEVWKEYQKGTLNGIPSIGIQIHKPGQPEVEDMQVDLVSGKTMDLDMLRYYSEINVEETAIQKICELVENLQDVEIVYLTSAPLQFAASDDL